MPEDVQQDLQVDVLKLTLPQRLRRVQGILSLGRVAESQSELAAIVEAYPDSMSARLVLARALCAGGRQGPALEHFDQVLSASTRPEQRLEAFEGKALALAELGRLAEASAVLLEVPKLDELTLGPVLEMVRIALRIEQPSVAMELLSALRKAGMDCVEVRIQSYRAFAALGDLAQARGALDEALVMAPQSAQALRERTQLNWATGAYAQALDDCEAALAAGCDDADIHWAHGHLLKRADRHSEAAAAYERFRAALPEGTP